MTDDPRDAPGGPDDPNRPAPLSGAARPPRAGARRTPAQEAPPASPQPPERSPQDDRMRDSFYGESLDPTAPPRHMSFRGAPATVVLVVGLCLIEATLYLGGRVLGVAEGVMGPNLLRERVLDAFAFAPIQLTAALDGTMPAIALSTTLTHALLHGGLLHLGFNMAAMAALSPPAERRIGGLKLVALFLLSGIAGALGHALWQYGAILASGATDDRLLYTGLVGASGAICGILGFDLRRRYEELRHIPAHRRRVAPGRWLWNASAGFILINVALSLMDSLISGAAHLGGFFAGLALAPLFLRRR